MNIKAKKFCFTLLAKIIYTIPNMKIYIYIYYKEELCVLIKWVIKGRKVKIFLSGGMGNERGESVTSNHVVGNLEVSVRVGDLFTL